MGTCAAALQTPAPSHEAANTGVTDTDIGLWCRALQTSHGIDERAGAGVAEVNSRGMAGLESRQGGSPEWGR